MTASVVEVIASSVGSGATVDFPITTTLVSSDVVVVATSRGFLGTVTPTGLGVSWTQVFSGAASARVLIHSATGATGSGHEVTITADSTAMGVVIYVVSGLNSATVVEEHSVWSTTTTAANTTEYTASQSFGTDQVAILIGSGTTAGTVTMPHDPTPSSGWTTDLSRGTTPRLYAAHQVATAPSGTVIGGIRCTSTIALGITCVVLGSETAATPLVSTFTGWGNPIF